MPRNDRCNRSQSGGGAHYTASASPCRPSSRVSWATSTPPPSKDSRGTKHFKHLLDELRLKRNFIPEIVFIDYLNICASSRFKMSGSINSYTYVKAIAEELRGLAVENGIPIFTATQTNRGGFGSTDVELTDTSESFGLPQTADFMFAIITSEQLESLGQVQIKQLKNRYADPASNRRFVVGIDRSKMKLFDLDASAQQQMLDTGQEEEDEEEGGFRGKVRKKFGRKFDGWG